MVPGKLRKIRLSPLQREVLWMLEEAGSETLPTLANTLGAKFPHEPRDALLAATQDAVRDLHDAGLVSLGREYVKPGERWKSIPPEEVARFLLLSDVLRWDEERGFWHWDEVRAGTHRVALALTEVGEEALRH